MYKRVYLYLDLDLSLISSVRIPFFDDWQLGCLKNERNISLIARDEETNSLQGVIIMEVLSAEVKEEDQKSLEVKLPRHKQCPDKMAAIFTFLDWNKSGLDVAQVYGVSEWVDLAILCCNTDTRTPGLGTQLCISGLKAVQDNGFKVFFCLRDLFLDNLMCSTYRL